MIIRGNEVITIRRFAITGTDDYGNPVKSSTTVVVPDCLFAYGATGEPVEMNRDPIDAALTLYMPAGTEIHDDDVFEIRGSEWVKDGNAAEWPQLWPGFVPDVVVSVRQRRG